MRGGHCLKGWSQTQTTIALSSAEAELSGLVVAATQSIGLRSVAMDLGLSFDITLWSDAAAAIGIARRKGLGRVRHLDVADLWIQDKIKSNELRIENVAGADNPADMLTKYVENPILMKHVAAINMTDEHGRADSAPDLTDAQRFEDSPEPIAPENEHDGHVMPKHAWADMCGIDVEANGE